MISSLLAPLAFTVAVVSPPAVIFASVWWYLYSKQLEIGEIGLTEEDLE